MEEKRMISGKIDLHMHTKISDGTDTPEELVACVKKAGISLFSVTDHDTIKSSTILPEILNREDPEYITGVEFSCKDPEGKYHILGYGYDPGSEDLQAVVEKGHTYRMKKVRTRLAYLKKEFSFSFPEEEINDLLSLDNPGKPHIGNMMVKYGFAKTKNEAIHDYIDRLHIKTEYIRPEEAIRGILAAGGIPVLAHPSYGDGNQIIMGDEMEQRLRRLTKMGLKGAEAFYSGFSEKLRNEILDLAEKYALYVTAGSDYHGMNKLVIPGDTGLEGNVLPEGMQRFLRDVRRGGKRS